jgi:hypothetical protein
MSLAAAIMPTGGRQHRGPDAVAGAAPNPGEQLGDRETAPVDSPDDEFP